MIANNCDTFADGVTCDDMLALGLWIIEQCDAKRAWIEAEDEIEEEDEDWETS